MKKSVRILIIGFLMVLFACKQQHKKPETIVENIEKSPNLISIKHDTALSTGVEKIIFGIFCGECSYHCATMYQLNLTGDSAILLVDYSDSFFKKGGINCTIPITDQRKLKSAINIIKNIPESFLTSTKLHETFGCPDCTDGCGIYFEMTQNKLTKKFSMDFENNFGRYLATIIREIEKK
jgi:hypothetical protein